MSIEGLIGICTECKSPQSDQYLIKKGFGWDAPCQFCKGVISAVPAQYQDDKQVMQQIKDNMDRDRGLGSTIHPGDNDE